MSRARGEEQAGRDVSPPLSERASSRDAVEPLLTPDTVARLLACSPKSVYSWAARGLLPTVRLGRLVRFRPSDVHRFIDANLG
jgi:excisionase family DNA binding protein